MIKRVYLLLLTVILFHGASFSQTFCSGTTNLTIASGSFSDGSGVNNYADNSDCYWLIQPAGAGTITLKFTAVDLEPYQCSDKVRVYDGSDTLSSQLAVVCGSTIPASITSTGGSMLIRFTSDVSYTYGGWDATYTSTVAPPVYCSGTLTMVAPSGSFEDGSGPSNYNDNTNCSWLIKPPGVSSITLSFSAFNTQQGHDFLKVYEGDSASAPMIGSFSGSTLPQQLTIPSGSMLVKFSSDNAGNDLGWTASYTSVNTTGIKDNRLTKPFSLFPNPFHQTATLQFAVPEPEACELQITDLCGKLLKNIFIPSFTSSLLVDMASMPNGMYLYRISKNNGVTFTGKMIIE